MRPFISGRSVGIFDPRTSALLRERTVALNPPPAYNAKPGAREQDATYITSGIVAGIGQVPRR